MRSGVGVMLLMLSSLLVGCGEQDVQGVAQRAVAIESADECHLCGMLITSFPGPKGELVQQGSQQVRKFCSTRDLFAYALDPEHRASIQKVWVHDMAKAPWEYPDDEHFVDARKAWYVINSDKLGAMGPSLASFSEEADAKLFVASNGGEILSFDNLSLDVLNRMTSSAMPAKQQNPAQQPTDDSEVDPSKMDHSAMDHSVQPHSPSADATMAHSSMPHSTMAHSSGE